MPWVSAGPVLLYVLTLPFLGPGGKTLEDQHGATLYALRRGNR